MTPVDAIKLIGEYCDEYIATFAGKPATQRAIALQMQEAVLVLQNLTRPQPAPAHDDD